MGYWKLGETKMYIVIFDKTKNAYSRHGEASKIAIVEGHYEIHWQDANIDYFSLTEKEIYIYPNEMIAKNNHGI
jgi:hypothetical protein